MLPFFEVRQMIHKICLFLAGHICCSFEPTETPQKPLPRVSLCNLAWSLCVCLGAVYFDLIAVSETTEQLCQTQVSCPRTLAVVWVGLAINWACLTKRQACGGPLTLTTDGLCTRLTLTLACTTVESRQPLGLPLESPWPSTLQEPKGSSHSFSSTMSLSVQMLNS